VRNVLTPACADDARKEVAVEDKDSMPDQVAAGMDNHTVKDALVHLSIVKGSVDGPGKEEERTDKAHDWFDEARENLRMEKADATKKGPYFVKAAEALQKGYE